MAFAVLIVLMVMLVLMAFAVLVMLVMVMLMLVFVVVAGALGIIALVMMVMMMGLLVYVDERLLGLDGGEQLCGGQLVPGSGDDACVRIDGAQQLDGLVHLLGGGHLGAGKDDALGGSDLIGEELAEVAGVNAAAVHVGDGCACLKGDLDLICQTCDHVAHLGQLADAGGLDDDAVGMILVDQLDQRVVEITCQSAADAAGVQLGDLDAGVLHERAVNAYFAVFVLKQHQLLAFKGAAGEQLLDKGGLARAEETGNYIDTGHNVTSPEIICHYYSTGMLW